jgi:multiple sugar transport system substrate-binding protein
VGSLQKILLDLLRRAILLILVVPAVLLLAFGPRGIDKPPRDKVIVDYWEKWTGVEGRGIQTIVNDFNRTEGAKKGIFVRCLSTSDVVQKTLVSIAAGVPPDVAGLYDPNLAQFAARDALEPLDEMAAAHGITSSTYKKVFWNQCHYNGKLYGLVSTPYDYALYINTKQFRAAGLDPTKPPTTIAELDADAKRMDVLDSSGKIKIAGFLPLEPGWTINSTPIWFGGNWWDQAHKRFCFTDPKVIQAFTWVQSYSHRLGQEAVSTFRSGLGNYDSPQNAFFAQTVSMEQQGTFFANFIQGEAPALAGNWAVAPFPSNDPELKDVTFCGSDMLTIPRGAKHPQEAFEFIAYVNRQDVMEKLNKLHCKISPLAKVSSEFLSHHTNPYIAIFDRLAASPNAHSSPPVPIMPEVSEEMGNFIQKLALLQVTPESGLQEVQDHLQKKLDDFLEEQRLRSAIN